MKQETLEEAAENYGWRIKINTFSNPVKANDLANSAKQDFIEGAKWQQEKSRQNHLMMDEIGHFQFSKPKMYSEEDMKFAFEAGHKKGFSGYPNTENWKELSFDKWFEQFSKLKNG
jgi:hypothetical protein